MVADTGAPSTNINKCDNKSSTFVQEICQTQSCLKQFSTYDGQVSYALKGTEEFDMGDSRIFNSTIYCMEKGNMINILGLSPMSNFIRDMYNGLNLTNQAFTIYLGQDKGKLIFGQDYDNSTSIPYLNNSAYYTVNVTSIQGENGDYIYQYSDEYEFIVDSGATLMIVQPNLYQEFQKSFQKCLTDPRGCPIQKDYQGQDCYLYDWNRFGDVSNFFGVFPTFNFTFDEKYIYYLEPADYLLKVEGNFYCLPLDDYTRNYEQKYKKISLLGQPFMRYKEFTFDQKNKQISIKKIKTFTEKLSVGEYQFLYKYIGIIIVLILGLICYTKFGYMIPQVINRQGNYNPYG